MPKNREGFDEIDKLSASYWTEKYWLSAVIGCPPRWSCAKEIEIATRKISTSS